MVKKRYSKERSSTLFLQIAIYTLAVVVLGLSVLILPSIFYSWSAEYPDMTALRYPFVLGIGLTIIPFLFALYQALRLLKFINSHTAFSQNSVRALRGVKLSALAIALVYALELPIVFAVAQAEDAPGLILMWTALFVGLPVVIAVFSALAQQLLKNIIDIKSENDLTV